MSSFQRDLTHIRGMFPPDPRAPSGILDRLVDQIQPAVDVLGTHRIRDFVIDFVSAANVEKIDGGTPCPQTKVRHVLFAYAAHDAAAGTKNLWFSMSLAQAGVTRVFPFTNFIAVAINQPVALTRNVIIPPNGTFQGRADVPVGVGVTLQMAYCYVELPLGEYLQIGS